MPGLIDAESCPVGEHIDPVSMSGVTSWSVADFRKITSKAERILKCEKNEAY